MREAQIGWLHRFYRRFREGGHAPSSFFQLCSSFDNIWVLAGLDRLYGDIGVDLDDVDIRKLNLELGLLIDGNLLEEEVEAS
jgi:hypothetical protein